MIHPVSASLPAFNYHGIAPKGRSYAWTGEEGPYVLSFSEFEAQLDRVAGQKFMGLTLSELNRWLQGKGQYEKPAMVTFDDGHLSHYEQAFEALKRRNLHAIFFVSAAWVGRPGFMTPHHLKELAGAGFEIGSHGMNHIPLTKVSEEGLAHEVGGSKKMLEDLIGSRIKSFSVPRGYFRPRISRAAKEAGYEFVFTSRYELIHPYQDPFSLGRLAVRPGTSNQAFDGLLHGRLGWRRYWEWAKTTARGIVPPGAYDRLAGFKRSFCTQSSNAKAA